jgi:hypothetical protein
LGMEGKDKDICDKEESEQGKDEKEVNDLG